MKFLVVGATGLVGNIAFREFSKDVEHTVVFGSYFSQKAEGLVHLNMQNKKEVRKIVARLKPDIIIHPAANPNAEYCEEHPIETRQVNVEGSRNIVESAKDAGAKLVFFSSDYIFDGASGPYSEDDPPNPINEYGRQKLDVENIIKKSLDDYLIIRTTVVYGWEARGKNFVMRLIRNLSQGIPAKVPRDQIGTPTYANNMIRVVKELIQKDKTGVYNVVGCELMDRYSFAKIVADVFELDGHLMAPVTTDEIGQKARRPLNAGLRIEKVKNEVSTRLFGAREGLEDMKKNRRDFHE